MSTPFLEYHQLLSGKTEPWSQERRVDESTWEVCIFLPGTLFSPCRLKKTVFLRKSMWGFGCWPLWPTITCIQMKLGVMNEKEWEGIRLTHHVLVLYWPLHNTGNLLLTAFITITNFRLMNMVAEHNRFVQTWSVSQRIHVWYIYHYLPTFTIQINQMNHTWILWVCVWRVSSIQLRGPWR